MAHVILTGRTGTAGSAVFARCIASSSLTRIPVLPKRPVKEAQSVGKVDAVYARTARAVEGSQWDVGGLQGISAGVPTLDYPLAAAKAFATLSPLYNIVYDWGERVDLPPFSPARMALPNSSLISLIPIHPLLRIYNVRPAFIDDTQDAELKQGKRPSSYALMDEMALVLRPDWPSGVSPSGKLAGAQVRCVEEQGAGEELGRAYQGKGVRFNGETEGVGSLIENIGWRRLAGL